MIVIVISCSRYALGQLPDELGQLVEYRVAVCRAVGVVKIVCPRQRDVFKGCRKFQRLFVRELRLVGEYRGHGLSEAVADLAEIRLVSHFYEALDGCFVHRVDICIAVVARGGVRLFEIGVKHSAALVGALAVGKHTV